MSFHTKVDPRQDWDNWFITFKNRHNGAYLQAELSSIEDIQTINIDHNHWKLYISMHLHTGEIFQTSNIIAFSEKQMEVTTKNGSLYKLKKPVNDSQLKILRLYFSQSE